MTNVTQKFQYESRSCLDTAEISIQRPLFVLAASTRKGGGQPTSMQMAEDILLWDMCAM